MHSVSSTSSWSLEYVPPSADYLLNCQIENSPLDIEDALCTPSNQKLFLTASMMFLQNQLIRKLDRDSSIPKIRKPRQVYSNLLIIETSSKAKRGKYFIRLKNTEQYDEILRKESKTPGTVLSLDQILPLPKKSPKQTKSTIFNFFKTMPSPGMSITRSSDTEKSFRLHSIFKKNLFRHKLAEQGSMDDLLKLKETRCQLYVDLLPSASSMISIKSNAHSERNLTSMTSLAANRLKMAPSFAKPYKPSLTSSYLPASPQEEKDRKVKRVKIRIGQFCDSSRKEFLERRGEHRADKMTSENLELLQFLSKQQARSLKKSLSKTSCNIQQNCDIEKNNGGNLKITTNSKVNILTKCHAKTKLEQQSKLSVCIEDNPESEDEEFECVRIFNCSYQNCTNFTDEAKSKFSSEYNPLVVKHT